MGSVCIGRIPKGPRGASSVRCSFVGVDADFSLGELFNDLSRLMPAGASSFVEYCFGVGRRPYRAGRALGRDRTSGETLRIRLLIAVVSV